MEKAAFVLLVQISEKMINKMAKIEHKNDYRLSVLIVKEIRISLNFQCTKYLEKREIMIVFESVIFTEAIYFTL